MTKAVITVKAEDGVETAAYLMYKFKIGALPVVDATNKVVGIISDTDVFKAFVDLLGYAKTSTKITVDTQDKVGVLAELAEIFKNRGVNIISVVTRKSGPKRAAHYGTGRSDQCHGHHPDHPGCRVRDHRHLHPESR